MLLSSGTKLGPYQIVSAIGAGGMGEVYRARDPRIGREVAIKVLPSAFSTDAERLSRFEQEARAAGMLNHPGILSVYDVGHENGMHFLVSELLEGETLRGKLAGALPQRRAIDYSLQIAKSLSAAHEKGITHRDLKPENLFITDDGRVKILDFGLAKLTQQGTMPEVSRLETGAQLSTPGMIMGTVGYMSPEQVRGKTADARSDIFAFGAILYEMISGKRAFHGETSADTMSAILSKEPPDLSDSNSNLSPAMSRIVEHCMEKNPEQRFQSMRDVAFYLETLSGTSTAVMAPAVAPPARSVIKNSIPWIIAGLMSLIAVVATLYSFKSKSQSEKPVLRFNVSLEGYQRSMINAYGALAISPDGQTIVYTGVENQTLRLYMRKLDSFESKAIPGTEDARSPFFSPDGKWIGFLTQHALKKIQLSGDTPVSLCAAANPRGASWGDNGTIVFSPFYYSGLSKISADGGAPQPLTTLDKSKGERNHRWPFVLPGGKAALFTIGIGGRWSDARIGAVRLDTGERKIILQGGFGARYLPTGHMIFGRGDALYIIGFDPEKLETHGDPVKILSGVGDSTAGTLEYAFSQNGVLIALPPGLTYDEEGTLALFNRKGEREDFTNPALNSVYLHLPKFSPDGTLVVGDLRFEVWIYDLKRGTSARLTSGSRTGWPCWTPDGKRVTYASEQLGSWNPFWRAADGSDEAQPVFKGDSVLNPTGWSPDGKKLLLYRDTQQTNSDVVMFDAIDGKLHDIVATPAVEMGGIFSPDGRWIAYTSDESGRTEVYVRSFNGPPGRWQISTNGGDNPIWKQQNEILYTEGEKVMRASIQTMPSFSAGTPELLFNTRFVSIDATSDHQHFIATLPREKEKQDSVNVIVNWFEEVRQLSAMTNH